jgi:hypothetical protein
MYFPAKIGSIIFKASISSAEKRKTPTITQRILCRSNRSENKIALVTAINHPDVAALKRSIESNAQRTVTIKTKCCQLIKEYDVLILYQPNIAFKRIFEENMRLPTLL